MLYTALTVVHILSAAVLFGTGMGIAFFMWMAHRRGDVAHIASTARLVVIADACFTAPAVLVQLGTGLAMMHIAGWTFGFTWLRWALILFLFVGACWLPVLWLQWRVRDLAREAAAAGQPLPPRYHRYMRIWFWLGWPAFLSVVAIYILMEFKPS
ncbi:DUF2269 family protein [Luteimonas sp. e5]